MQMCKDASATKNQRKKPANSRWAALQTDFGNRRAENRAARGTPSSELRTPNSVPRNQKAKQKQKQKRVQLQRQNAKYISF
ncbi:hypothetical protein M5D96_009401 [Drosophila gunungcola]|uniref:Uncharacterized protein n=1 Tax=Drosophila gunungcola TaxID=103775 RepID=A0A9P9YJ12_9MUSC|nr:hypothetical protein M5D96_009401 [Drosophila gunungcola]